MIMETSAIIDPLIFINLLPGSWYFSLTGLYIYEQLRRMQEMIAKMQAEMNQKNTPQKMQQNGEVKSQNV